MRAHWTSGLATVVLAMSVAVQAKDPEPAVKYPTGYRKWAHTKTMAIVSDRHPLFNAFSGIHHIYVNEIGLKAARSRGVYPDGSVIVFDLLEWIETDGASGEGARKLIGVMQKDAKRFASTGGWGYEGFKGGDAKQRLVTDPTNQCYNCHAAQKEHDSVFSQYRE